jgi:putative ABC transport system permease protein
MNIFETIRTALRAINANKMRSGLTILGMIIGVAAVISLMSIGRGSQAAITSNIESLGTNLLFVRAGATTTGGVRSASGSATTLTLDDAYSLVNATLAPAVKAVAPEIQTMSRVIIGSTNTFSRILGVTSSYESVRNYTVAEGSFITDTEVSKKKLVAVLGSTVAETLFPDSNAVGETIKIGGIKFTVVGVLESKGDTGSESADDMIIAPITTVQSRLYSSRTASGKKNVSTIYVQATSADTTDAAITQVTAILREQHSLTSDEDNDFTITSQESTIAALKESTSTWVIFLGAIAGISLLVGGIGIMNIMLVSVTERTREIGIRKSLGAKRQDILLQFLVEAAILSLVGGGLGMGIGIGLSHFLNGMTLGSSTISTVMSMDIPILAVSVSAAMGIVFGLYPAYRAAQLSPIDALRYE